MADPARPQLASLTGLRFLAAAWVVGFHALPRSAQAPHAWSAFWDAGYTGVGLFFVLSGFILVYTYGPPRDGAIDTRRFLGARVARLLPVYLFSLAIGFVEFLRNWHGGANDPGLSVGQAAGTLIATPLLVQAWFPTLKCMWNCPGWSLSAEAFFYLSFPLLAPLLAVRRTRSLVAIGAGALGASIILGLMRMHAEGATLVAHYQESQHVPLFRLPEFIMGMAAGRWFLDHPSGVGRDSGSILASAGAFVAVALTAIAPVPSELQLAALAPVFTLLVVTLAFHGSAGPLSARTMIVLGEVSYSVYLLHGPLHVYALASAKRIVPGSLTGHPWPIFFAYSAVVLSLSYATYRYLERPARRAIRARLSPPRAPAAVSR